MRVLLTAFEPYDDWTENSSWTALVELLKERPSNLDLVTRRYPVDLQGLRKQLHKDLTEHYDAVLHLGQSPGSAVVKLEAFALNVAGCVEDVGEELPPIVASAPLAFRSQLPLGRWAHLLRSNRVPAKVSYHAGTYLCNATMYLTHYWYHSRNENTHVGFVHLPLTTEQVALAPKSMPSLSTATLAAGVRLMLRDLALNYTDAESLPSRLA